MLWGLVIVVLGLLAWGGQTLSWFAPATAARLGLADAEGSVDDQRDIGRVLHDIVGEIALRSAQDRAGEFQRSHDEAMAGEVLVNGRQRTR